MINAMLLRIHQSGHLAELTKERTDLVKEGIACYKSIRADIKKALPFYPLDIADNEDLWVCAGLKLGDKAYLAVWKRTMEGKNNNRRKKNKTRCTDNELTIPLGSLPFAEKGIEVTCIYPKAEPVEFSVVGTALTVNFPQPVMARLFEVTAKK